MRRVKAKGTLAKMLANMDEQQLHKTENKMLVAVRIGMAMRARGWNNKQLAEAMNCPASDVSDWLSGTRNFTIDKLSEIERTLDVELLNHSLMVSTKIKSDMLQTTATSRKTVEFHSQVSWKNDFSWTTRYAETKTLKVS